MPACDAVGAGRRPDPEIARSEYSATTSDRVQAVVRITPEGPIAPDRPSPESADSRRVAKGTASRSAISRPAEPASQAGMPARLRQQLFDDAAGGVEELGDLRGILAPRLGEVSAPAAASADDRGQLL